jgi:primosomal protein N' (replication factor Y)
MSSLKLTARQSAVVDFLAREGAVLLAELTRALGMTAAPVRVLEKKGVVTVEPSRVLRDPKPNRNILPTQPLKLMPQQDAALRMVRKSIETLDPSVVLLFGVTGSGKTEVYLQAIEHVVGLGQGAIVLVPEISLTPQTMHRFVGRFGDRVAVLHSHLSDGERHDEWHRIRDGRADIVIGARSAVFAPLNNLGLIVVDEEHEPSYKQEDSPRYNARDTAVMRGHIEKCSVVLGSATPSLESWTNAAGKKYGLAVLPNRVDNRKMPNVRIVDMRLETSRTGRAGVFSKDLLEALRQRVDRGEQSILFLNRRGFATSLICPKCGYVAECDQCSVSLTYHRRTEELRCHICGGRRAVPAGCPACRDPAFKFSGVGTQRIEDIVKRCFPRAAVQRIDTDVTTRKDAYERILGDFRSGRIDILIGTQMIAKGLHFPNVTLVGVMYADLSLHMPDFRAGERTFQLLAQVAGRAGRGDLPGEVIVQTYTPFHMAVQAARRMDYEGFCDQEIESRRELKYPPFSHLICLTLKGRSEEKVAFCAASVARKLRKAMAEHVTVSDAAPAPLARARGLYRYQVMLRSRSAGSMSRALREMLPGFKLPGGVTVSADVDALSLL